MWKLYRSVLDRSSAVWLGRKWRKLRYLAIILAVAAVSPTGQRNPAQAQPQNGHRVDIPFTRSVVTPHIPWDLPSAGPPICAFVVPSVTSGRTLIELAERIPLSFHTVMIDEAWDADTYIGTEQDYEARTYPVVYQYLTQDLTASAPYDVIVIPSLLGWNRLPPAAREAIRKRVEEGEGLVLIHPTTGLPAPGQPQFALPTNHLANPGKLWPGQELWDLSPLVGVLSDELGPGGDRRIPPEAVTTGPWRITSPHFITANLPLEAFPYSYLKHYKYHLGKDSTALVVGEHGEPIVAVKRYGKGRVVALGYVNTGLSPMIDWSIMGQHSDHWWEYFYSLLGRSIIWAAHRQSSLTLAPLAVLEKGRTLSIRIHNSTSLSQAEISASMVNEWGEKEGSVRKLVKLHAGSNAATLNLPPYYAMGRHDVDVILSAGGKHYDWGGVSFDAPKTDEITAITTDRQFYARGDTIHVSFKTQSGQQERARVELWDNRGRLVARSLTSEGQAALKVGNYTTNIGWVRVTLLGPGGGDRSIDRKAVRVNFARLDRNFGAYELVMPWGGPPSYQPWIPTLDAQMRKMGLTVFSNPERNFKMMASLHLSSPQEQWFGAGWNQRGGYIDEKDKFLQTHDTRYLIRHPDIADDKLLDKLQREVRASMKGFEGYRPMAYFLADESSLTSYEDPFDFSWSPATLTKFRQWLKTQYPSLAALNREWESRFTAWGRVMPLYTAEAQAKGNYAGWMDHRTFMEKIFTHAFQVAADAVHEEDSGSLASISGTQSPGPSNGINWYLLDHVLDYLQPYSDDDQDELHRTMRPGLLLTGFTGYARHGVAERWELWHRLFHGQAGASLFWQYTAVNPDLTLSEQGRDLEATINEFRHEGLAVLLRGAHRENCGIAVHYSLRSLRGEWITDGRIRPGAVVPGDSTSAHLKRFHANRHAWLQALEDAGYQYDFLTTEQIDKLSQYRVLILPDSIALTDAEVAAIRQFVRRGGLLLADADTGLMDGHGRWQAGGRLDDVLGVKHQPARTAPNAPSPVQIHLNLNGETLDLNVLTAAPNLVTTSGQAQTTVGSTPLLINHRYGQGSAITLNFWMMDYIRLRRTGVSRPRLRLLRYYLHRAGIQPIVTVQGANGEPPVCSERIAFQRGDARYLVIIQDPYGSAGFPNYGDPPATPAPCVDSTPMTVTLPAPRYVYDLRAHRYLGYISRLRGSPSAGSPWVLALEASPIGRLSVAAQGAGRAVKAGDTVHFSIRLSAGQGRSAPDCPVDVQVRNAAGKVLDYYNADLLLRNGAGQFTLPLALSDAPGTWRVTAREPFTHRVASTTFAVTR